MSQPQSLFVPAGPSASPGTPGVEHWLPTELARGPWDPGALHGGPVGALLTRAIERAAEPTAVPGRLARLTLELLRPVPTVPLAVTASVTRPGRKVQVIEAEMTAEGRPVARCRALRLRTDPAGTPLGAGSPAQAALPFPGPEAEGPPKLLPSTYRGFHNAGAELRYVRGGGVAQPGPASVWVRLTVPVVPEEIPTGVQRTVAAADFGNGVSAVLPFDAYTFINPDLTVFCARDAVGEWVALDAETSLGAGGTGLARSTLWDLGGPGPVGGAVQCLLVEAR